MISILVLFLLGVVNSRHSGYHSNSNLNQPMITKTQERHICAELCMVGLGGEPCGYGCSDLIPAGLPTLSQSDSEYKQSNGTRHDACPLLCENQLGYPLCGCNYTTPTAPFFKVNFLQICWHYSCNYNYVIHGCDECSFYKTMIDDDKASIEGVSAKISGYTYDWNAWCIEMCRAGDGGAACYCDLLPLALDV